MHPCRIRVQRDQDQAAGECPCPTGPAWRILAGLLLSATCWTQWAPRVHSQPALDGSAPWTAAPGGWAGPRQAQAALSLQAAEAVLVGHPGGHAQPTGGGAGAPGRAPFWAGDTEGRGGNEAGKLGSSGWEGLGPQPPSLVAHPLGAALARDLHPHGVGAVPAGQPHVLIAQWHAGEAAVLTATEGSAVWLEGVPVPVQAAVHLTAPSLLCEEARGPPAAGARPGLANQALAGVADVEVVTGLPQPPCTYPAAATAIGHQRHPRRASGRRPGAGARCRAQLGRHLREEAEEEGQQVRL